MTAVRAVIERCSQILSCRTSKEESIFCQQKSQAKTDRPLVTFWRRKKSKSAMNKSDCAPAGLSTWFRHIKRCLCVLHLWHTWHTSSICLVLLFWLLKLSFAEVFSFDFDIVFVFLRGWVSVTPVRSPNNVKFNVAQTSYTLVFLCLEEQTYQCVRWMLLLPSPPTLTWPEPRLQHQWTVWMRPGWLRPVTQRWKWSSSFRRTSGGFLYDRLYCCFFLLIKRYIYSDLGLANMIYSLDQIGSALDLF